MKRTSFKRTLNDEQKEVKEADSKFSKYIINRDKRCLRCNSASFLSCSHFYGRSIWYTRYEPYNCITLCVECHQEWESKKKTDYKQFMFELLGINNFLLLEAMSKIIMSPSQSIELHSHLFKDVDTIQY